MSYIGIMDFGMMILITTLLLKKKVSTLFASAIIPIIEALLVGTSITEVCDYINVGLGKTRDLMFIISFSLPYSPVMSEIGLFDIMVEFLLKHAELSVTVICIITVLVSLITEIDGSVTSTYLVTIPMIPLLYKKLKIGPKVLLLLCPATMCALFVMSWNGRTLRAVALLEGIGNPQNYILSKMLPMILIYIVLCTCLAVILARIQVKRGAGQMDEQVDTAVTMEFSELKRPKLFWFNLTWTILLIIGLSTVPCSDYFISTIGLIVAPCVNYPDLRLQSSLLKKYSQEMYSTACAVFLSGVVAGVLSESGMMDAMAGFLIRIIPSVMGPWVYLIIALLSILFVPIFTNDIWQYALVLIVAGTSNKFGIPGEVVIPTLLMNMGAMVSPVAQPQIYLACDLADGTELTDYVKSSFTPLWILSVLWVVIRYCIGIFRQRIQLRKGSTSWSHVNGR